MEETEHPIIEIDASFEYRDGEVYVKRLVTNEMPIILSGNLILALSKTIEEYYLKRGNNENSERDS